MSHRRESLRIAQIVTLVTPSGAYGGPVRVATNQAKALEERGHQVTIFGGFQGFDSAPSSISGIRSRLFPTLNLLPGSGFAGTWSPQLQTHLERNLRDYDVVHVHLARDLITLPAARKALLKSLPLVLQTHGMIDASSNPLSGPLDAFLTRKILREASALLYLTDRERLDLRQVAGEHLPLEFLPNGVPESGEAPARSTVEVLFLARLQERKRPMTFVRAAITLSEEFPNVRFSLVGPDEGQGKNITRLIDERGLHDQISWEGPLPPDSTLERMSRASIYALPSVNEPFPMAVLEAMSVGLPVVITDSCGLAPAVKSNESGIVVDSTEESFTDALKRLLSDDALRANMSKNARQAVKDSFSMSAVADELEGIYIAAKNQKASAAGGMR